MAITYTDLIDTVFEVRSDARNVHHIVITEDTKEVFMENMNTESVEIPKGDRETVNSFDVEVGNTNKVVTERGYTYDIDE